MYISLKCFLDPPDAQIQQDHINLSNVQGMLVLFAKLWFLLLGTISTFKQKATLTASGVPDKLK